MIGSRQRTAHISDGPAFENRAWREVPEKMEANDVRKEVHEEIDRMTDEDVKGLKQFLATYPDPMGAAFRNAPYDDEPFTEEDRRLLAEAEEWLEHNDGKGIPHEELMRDLGLE